MEQIINHIVYELYLYAERFVVPTESNAPKPEYPYLSYKVTTLYNSPNNQGNYSTKLIQSLDDRFEHDIEETLELQPTFTISINAYSKDSAECQGLIKKAYDWFRHAGYDELNDVDVVVVDVAAFTDRTLLIVNNYESRIGFDVILRTTDVIKRRINTIEEYSIKEVK